MNKNNVRRKLTIGLLFAVVLTSFTVSYARAQSTTINVQLGPVITDVCPNILGVQAAVPDGMIIDGNGDCVTPTPPPVDVCNNIAGNQDTIPVGYYRDGDGACFPQPTPPVDVCPNLFGVQSVVPSSLIVDAAGNCVAPPVDECPNIDGPQSSIPEGMVKVDSVCFTPEKEEEVTEPVVPPSTTNTSGPSGPSRPDYKNVPAAFDALFEPLVNAVPESIKEAAKSVSPEISRTVPYYIYAVLGMSAAVLGAQALRELFATRKFGILLAREKSIAEQKDNFIALASHYLRTPLTLMRNGLDTIVALKELDVKTLAPLRDTIDALDENIKLILSDIESNEALKNIAPPVENTANSSMLRSVFFWTPIITSLVLAWVSNFLLGIVAGVDLGTANLLFQFIVIVAISMVFYTAFRNYHLRRQQRAQQQRLVEHERAIDAARNTFIHTSTAALQTGLSSIYASRNVLGTTPSAKFFDEGYMRFNNILEKFLLLGKIEANSQEDIENINLREVIDTVLGSMEETIKEKKITITNDINGLVFVKQNRALFEFVIHSVIDNAIKFNSEGGTINLSADNKSRELIMKVSDSGIGIPKDKLAQLFKPFSRADSALQFNYEGLGFSLFLDKIITDYMGGDIIATSTKDKGTDITVKTTLAHA